MFLRILLNTFLCIVTIGCNEIAESEGHSTIRTHVDIICQDIVTVETYLIGNLTTCYDVSKISVTNFHTKVRYVQNEFEHKISTASIELLYISKAPYFELLPSGIKNSFPKLKAFGVQDSGLIHVDQQDMQQFGSDLVWIRFFKTKITALQGDLFKYNPNLSYVDFSNNSMKYIDPLVFESLKKRVNVVEIDFIHSECVNKTFKRASETDIETFDWNANKCDDTDSEKKNQARINKETNINSGKCTDDVVRNIGYEIRIELQQEVDKLRENLMEVNNRMANFTLNANEIPKPTTIESIEVMKSRFNELARNLENISKKLKT